MKAVQERIGFVYGFLTNACPQVMLNYDIEDAIGAEQAVNAWFSTGRDVGGGIRLFLAVARLNPDAESITY